HCDSLAFLSPDTICIGNPVVFTNISFGCADSTHFAWHFSDGGPDFYGYNATHIFNTAGTFTVTLYRDSCSGASISHTVIVPLNCDSCLHCDSLAFLSPDTICIGNPVVFTNISFGCADSTHF